MCGNYLRGPDPQRLSLTQKAKVSLTMSKPPKNVKQPGGKAFIQISASCKGSQNTVQGRVAPQDGGVRTPLCPTD